MNKLILFLLLTASISNAYAARVRVASCPKNSENNETGPKTYLAHEAQGWKIGLEPFSFAFVSRTPNNLIYCMYGQAAFATLPMPKEFDQATCSFVKNSPQAVTRCPEKNPQDCVIYCEKK